MRIALKRRQSKKSYRKNILGVYFDDNLTTFLETLKVAKESYRIGYCHDSLVNFENLNLIYPVEKVKGGVSISWRNVLKTTSSDLPLEGIVFCLNGVAVITPAHIYSNESELTIYAGANPVGRVSKIDDGENLRKCFRLGKILFRFFLFKTLFTVD